MLHNEKGVPHVIKWYHLPCNCSDPYPPYPKTKPHNVLHSLSFSYLGIPLANLFSLFPKYITNLIILYPPLYSWPNAIASCHAFPLLFWPPKYILSKQTTWFSLNLVLIILLHSSKLLQCTELNSLCYKQFPTHGGWNGREL